MVRDQLERRGVRDPEVLNAMRRVPRHRFVDSALAYDDRALPLSHGQTISQPFVVALMTQMARPPGGWHGARVLEVGTGSGYQAAVLAELGASVVSVERDPDLSAQARANLDGAGYDSVLTEVGDGSAAGLPARPTTRSWSPPRGRRSPLPCGSSCSPTAAGWSSRLATASGSG